MRKLKKIKLSLICITIKELLFIISPTETRIKKECLSVDQIKESKV